jgi:hypothetical protein
MKIAFALFAALCIAVPPAAPQTATPHHQERERQMSADEAAIRQVSENWTKLYNAGDSAKVAALYTGSCAYHVVRLLPGKPEQE